MKIIICFLLCLCFISQAFGGDIILTKQNRKYNGKVIKRTAKGFVVRTVEGSVVVIPSENMKMIYQGNKVYNFDEGLAYYLEKRRPFLPFVILSVAAGAYSVRKYRDYQDHHDQAEAEKLIEAGPEYTNLKDQSKKDLAWCVVSGLFSLGSFYVALKPMEVRVPIGRINLSMAPRGVTLALHF